MQTDGSMYVIEFLPEAIDDLGSLRKFDQRRVVDEIEAQLVHEPNVETRNRKRLRPNALAEWELRVERFRVFFDVVTDTEIVRIVAIGYKLGNDLFIHGERFQL
jgi:mRNA-degrading endonuclease RelE of RelBE toxin-antitoxin system